MSEVDYKARIGAEVKARLLANPAAFRIDSDLLDIFIVRDFLDETECQRLIEMIDRARIPSQLLAPAADPEFRTSESCNLDPTNAFVRSIEAKLTSLLGIDPFYGETIQGQRYAVGQQFKPHHDFFYSDQPYWEEMMKSGGQRTWTAMMFLNAPEGGGETCFPEAQIKVSPRAGNLLAWNNMNAAGEPNEHTLHQGLPVTAGVKYIITKWHRESVWGYSNVPTY